jgi:hypothetical protein
MTLITYKHISLESKLKRKFVGLKPQNHKPIKTLRKLAPSDCLS